MPYGIQQPAISGQISQLERALGLRLFQRRPFAVTPAGLNLFAEIEPFFAGLRELPDRVRGHARHRLRLAAPATILRDYLPAILAGYRRRDPDFRLTLYDANQANAEDLLRKNEIDLAITELEGKPGASINSRTLVNLPLLLVLPRSTTIRSVADCFRGGTPVQSLISLRPEEVLSKNFQAGLRRLGLAWPSTIDVASLELIDIYTALGLGVGVSIALPGSRRKSGLRRLPLPKFPPLSVAALWAGDLSELAQTFLSDVKKLAERLTVTQ